MIEFDVGMLVGGSERAGCELYASRKLQEKHLKSFMEDVAVHAGY
jgi:hypothetical protein